MGLPPEVHISDSSRTILFKCGLYAVVYLPFQVTEHNFNGEHRPLRVRKRLRFSMCFLHQLSKVRAAQPPDLKVWSGDQNKLTMIQVKTVRDLVFHLDCHKSLRLVGTLRVLRELVDGISNPVSTICMWS